MPDGLCESQLAIVAGRMHSHGGLVSVLGLQRRSQGPCVGRGQISPDIAGGVV